MGRSLNHTEIMHGNDLINILQNTCNRFFYLGQFLASGNHRIHMYDSLTIQFPFQFHFYIVYHIMYYKDIHFCRHFRM